MLTKPKAKSRRPARWLPVPIAISLLVGYGLADAAEPTLAVRHQIEQPSQDMGDALRAIARVIGVPVVFDSRIVAGHTAKAVSGRLSGAEAIAAAVKDSGLESVVSPEGVVVVKRRAQPAAAPAPAAGSAPALLRTGTSASQFASVQASADDDVAGKPSSTPTEQLGTEVQPKVESFTRVEVTGSRLRRLEAEGPAPVNVYTGKDIEKSGQPNLQMFLASLTESSASAGEGAFSRTAGQATVQLRGLPLGSTLVLVNGRKVQAVGSSTGSVFNLNLIPLAAIERVEVVPSGSSAVYGGDALAGVVNIILKKSMNGQSLSVRLGTGRGFGDGSVSLAAGRHTADGNFLLIGAFSRATPLTMQDRDFFKNVDYRSIGGSDARQPYCTPGTVSSLSGNLPGLTSSTAAIPQAAPGRALTVADFQATAGTRNLCNLYATGGGAVLFHGTQTFSLHSLAEHRLGGNWTAFGEVMFTNHRLEGPGRGILLSGVTVPAANPFNPFGADVKVTSALGAANGDVGSLRRGTFTRVVAGVKGDLGGDWDAEVTASTSSDHGTVVALNQFVDRTALAAALASTTPSTSFNPFTAGRAANDAVLDAILSDDTRRDRGRKDQLSAVARGSLGQLPAGPVDAVIGAETARDWYDMVVTGTDLHGSRRSSAMYGELRAPLLAAVGEGSHGSPLAAVTVAARRDRYSDFGAASTFQGGLEVRPARDLLIRASAATSFKPPTLLQTNVPDIVSNAIDYGLVDPARNGEAINSGTVVRTTNKALQPEKGKAQSLGAVWEPEGGLGTRVSATYWRLKIRSMIAVLPTQTALNYESLFPGFVTRGPSVNGQPGVVTSIKSTEVNFGRLDTAGMDVDVAYGWKTSVGRLNAGMGATRFNEYRVLLAPGAPVVDRLGRRFTDFWAPRWKGRVSVGLDQGAWTVGLTSRYLGGYLDMGSSDRKLGDWWIHDVAATLNLKKLWPQWLTAFSGGTLGVSVANLTNRQPQYVSGVPNYDVTQADWRGRYGSVRLSLDW